MKDDILLIKLQKCHYKGKKLNSLKIALSSKISPHNGKFNFDQILYYWLD